MTQQNFPFGNDPRKVNDWLWMADTKSRNWLVAYIAGLSIGCGKHTLIFLGLDNLQIGVVTITGCGPTVALGTKAMNRGSGAKGKVRDRQIERTIENTEDAINNSDYFGDIENVSDAKSGLDLLNLLNNNASFIRAENPFSFLDIDRSWGNISGFNVDVYVAGAQVYKINMTPHIFFGPQKYIESGQVYNLDDGSIGAGIGVMMGKWSVERSYDLWQEASAKVSTELGLVYGSTAPDIHPNSTIPAIHPFLRELPIQGYPIPEDLIKKFFPK